MGRALGGVFVVGGGLWGGFGEGFGVGGSLEGSGGGHGVGGGLRGRGGGVLEGIFGGSGGVLVLGGPWVGG